MCAIGWKVDLTPGPVHSERIAPVWWVEWSGHTWFQLVLCCVVLVVAPVARGNNSYNTAELQ